MAVHVNELQLTVYLRSFKKSTDCSIISIAVSAVVHGTDFLGQQAE
jgi:hypothetical protein